MPKISVISPCSKPLQFIKNLRHCFKNQTNNDFEHIVIYDGQPTDDIIEFITEEINIDDKLRWYIFEPPNRDWGTELRNFGTMIANGEFVVFCDDDDIYLPNYIQSFFNGGLDPNALLCCKMNNYGAILPRRGIKSFPSHGDIGTPQCAFPIHWFREPHNLRWPSTACGGHDFHVVRLACAQFNPIIKILDEVGIVVRGDITKYYAV